jgi:hypothetical protein
MRFYIDLGFTKEKPKGVSLGGGFLNSFKEKKTEIFQQTKAVDQKFLERVKGRLRGEVGRDEMI